MVQNKEAVLEQIRELVADLSPEERLSIIQSIATVESVVDESNPEEIAWRDRLWAEQEEWFARPTEERQKYKGEYVAIQAGKVVDHDLDKRELYLRTRTYSKHAPVLLVHADWDAIPEYMIRSPRLVP